MTRAERILERLIDKLDYAAEYTEQVPHPQNENKRGWFLIKDGERKWFYTMKEIAEHLGVPSKSIIDLRHNRHKYLKSQGWSVVKVEETLNKC